MGSFLNVFSIQQNGEVNLNFEKETEIPHCVRKNTMKKSFIMGNFQVHFYSTIWGSGAEVLKKQKGLIFSDF